MEPMPQSLLEHYEKRVPLSAGRVGSLTPDETQKLRQLWKLLFEEFDRTDAQPFPVLFSLANASSNNAGENCGNQGDITTLSFDPLVSLSSKDDDSQRPKSAAPSPSPADTESIHSSAESSQKPKDSGKSSSWFSWRSITPSGRSTPAPTTKESMDDEQPECEESRQRREETVQAYMQRTQNSEPLVPENGFKPLFGEQNDSRTFRAAFWQAATQIGDADSWVLRFLRARKWDVQQAMEMIRSTLKWRTGQAIDEVVYFGESQLHYHTMDTGLAFACTHDRLNNPVYVVRVRVNIARNRNIQAIKRFLCWQIETSQLLSVGAADGRVTILFDLTDFTRENIDLQLVRTLISLLTNYYPETLGILLLYVNSWLFAGIWTLISPFIDTDVKSKIIMVKNTSDLSPYIDPDNLISEIGGRKKFDYKYKLPSSEENKLMADTKARDAAETEFVRAVDSYEAATRKWLEAADSNSDESILSLDAFGRDEARDALRKSTIALDPYVRARTLYHRFGFIGPDHSISF
ncbi:phosphatidylinositol transfer protein csr1 [Coemansia guatemalensis]|uniref:Phosphatidylinositol transfer protein csr1 n=1 Tax=Coemansia guatemalensis TaxID=2761395 RepID=A0A9W8LU40_9FUNG|nr:phosphatidylinositol transfer protein csr1 [Coemansia guatemalensis]